MVSEKYRRFLESETHRNPLKIESSMKKEHLTISWANIKERSVQTGSSDIIDSIYLGKDMQETVIMDRRVAATLQDHLRELEEENTRIRGRIKILKVLTGAFVVIVAIMSLILLKINFPRIG